MFTYISSSFRNNITIQPFKGCLKNLKLNKDFKPVDEQVGISKGCPKNSLVSFQTDKLTADQRQPTNQ